MKRIKLNGIELALVDEGSGPAVLLVHAFPLDHRIWDAQIEALAASYRVVVTLAVVTSRAKSPTIVVRGVEPQPGSASSNLPAALPVEGPGARTDVPEDDAVRRPEAEGSNLDAAPRDEGRRPGRGVQEVRPAGTVRNGFTKLR